MLNRGSPRARGRSQEILWAAASCTSADGLPVIDRAALTSRTEQNRAEQGTAEQNITSKKSREEQKRAEQSNRQSSSSTQMLSAGLSIARNQHPIQQTQYPFRALAHLCKKVFCSIPFSHISRTRALLKKHAYESYTHKCIKRLAANSL